VVKCEYVILNLSASNCDKIYTINNNYKFPNVKIQISVQFINNDVSKSVDTNNINSSHRLYLSHRPHTAVTHTRRTQTLQINCKQLIYKFTQYTVNTINNNSIQLTNECRQAPKRHDKQCALPHGPTPGRWRSSHCCLLRSRHFADTTRTDISH